MPRYQQANNIMKNLLKLFITYQLKDTKPRQKPSGFTLIELLVGLILTFLVITPLLGFLISIMTQDRQEQAKAASEQEIQSALNYISRDVDQAVFIYDGKGLPLIETQLPTVNSGTPVLVFWKRKFLPKSLPIKGVNDCSDQTKCDDAYVYSLVAYYQITGCTNNNWSCTSRIGRVELQGPLNNINNPASDGTVSPLNEPEPSPGFKLFDLNQSNVSTLEDAMNNWQNGGSNINNNKPEILIDYIDQSTANVPPASCSTAARDNETVPYQFRQVPPPPSPTSTSSFYACVDNDKPGQMIAQVFIRGNALARIRPKQNPPAYVPSQQAYFPRASIQAKGRGLVNLTPGGS
jgi:type II secretory pathway pseudopilin PulG